MHKTKRPRNRTLKPSEASALAFLAYQPRIAGSNANLLSKSGVESASGKRIARAMIRSLRHRKKATKAAAHILSWAQTK
jgi:DNA-binding response OmpR family regulator